MKIAQDSQRSDDTPADDVELEAGSTGAESTDDVVDDDAGELADDVEEDDERKAPAMLTRDFSIVVDKERLAKRAEGDERIPISFSSEQPVSRFDWWEGERYLEVLDHDPSSVDMTYARNGLSFLVEHNRGDQVGIVEDVVFGSDRMGRGMLRLSKSARGKDIAQDVNDGIRRFVSFGYTTGDDYTQTGGEEEGSVPTRRYTKWMPMEVSSVSIPADTSVGIGRSARDARRRPSHPPARQAREFPVRDQNGNAPAREAGNGGGNTPRVETRDFHAEIVEIQRICRDAKIDEKTERSFYERKLTPHQVKSEVFDLVMKRVSSLAGVPQEEQLGISDNERREYSLGRALQALVSGNWNAAGYEREVSSALAKKLDRSTSGILVPTNFRASNEILSQMQQRTSQSAGVAANGGNLVPSQMAGTLIELLRNKSVIDRMNPMRLPGLVGNVPIPRQTGAGTAATRAEIAAAAAEGNMTFDQVVLSPKNILGTQSYSKQLFAQSPFAIDSLVREDLTTILALLYDLQGLHGDGAGSNLTGIYAQAGVQVVAMGGAITFDKVVDMEAAIEAANANVGQMGYVTTPEIKGKAKKKLEFAVNGSSKLWTGTADEGEMNGYRSIASNQVAKNLGAGVNEHGIIFGAWGQAIVADWGAIDVTVDPYSRAREAVVNVTAHWLADFQLRYGAAFAKGTGLTNT